ncbi:hypothetical protein Purlil1_12827 [Purpureocillium lilacinum]|uniref:Uncharacterized protein n=1 Tax=Purpureocillium lilacinum TaxID=33203 RepID=A0ABR0BG57_PURLI|nr:hypothetical protein Purlil1_12827 [Purpureocillium lilacinum]
MLSGDFKSIPPQCQQISGNDQLCLYYLAENYKVQAEKTSGLQHFELEATSSVAAMTVKPARQLHLASLPQAEHCASETPYSAATAHASAPLIPSYELLSTPSMEQLLPISSDLPQLLVRFQQSGHSQSLPTDVPVFAEWETWNFQQSDC